MIYETLTESDFRKKIRPGVPGGIPKKYFFYGDEDYLKKYALGLARSAFIADPSFDVTRFDGNSFSPDAFSDALAVPPMFGQLRLVEITLSPSDLRPNEMNDFLSILEGISDDDLSMVIIVFPAGSFDPGYPKRPSAIFKKFAAAAVPVCFEKVTGARLNGWVGKHYSGNRVTADGPVCAFTVSVCGSDMTRLSSEIDKISWYVLASGRDRVTEDDVRAAGCATQEAEAFALSDAILSFDRRAALSALAVMKERQAEPVAVLAAIVRVICDLAAVSACRRDGMTPEAISTATGIKPYPLSKYLAAADRTSPERIRALLASAGKADDGVKGYAKDFLPVETFICGL